MERKDEHEPLLTPVSRERKRNQIMTLIAAILIKLGDSVELYLPSVITQPISCELNLTKDQEYILALALYLTLGIAIIATAPFSNKFGRRPVLLLAMYSVIIITIICAIVPNYTSLLLSRILIGFAVALNVSTTSVYVAETAINRKYFIISMTANSVAYTLGGGWCGVLGYLFLEKVGWRYFVLLTSLPLFIVPAILFQFFLPETYKAKEDNDISDSTALLPPASIETMSDNVKASSVISRVLKLCVYSVTRGVPYYGAILLVPAIIKQSNLQSAAETSPCAAIHGSQFLIITGIFGGCHLMGRLVGYLSHSRISSATILTLSAVICLTCTSVMVTRMEDYTFLLLLIGVIQFTCAASANETYIMGTDKDFFTFRYLALASGLQLGVAMLTIAGGNVISELLTYTTVIKIYVGFCAAAFPVALLFYHED